MGLEERIREAWERFASRAETAEEKAPAAALFRILNVPATAYNLQNARALVKGKEPVESFIRVADRYPPSFDLDDEEKFRAYLDTYERIRGPVSGADLVAFFRLEPTKERVALALAWKQDGGPFTWSKEKPPKP